MNQRSCSWVPSLRLTMYRPPTLSGVPARGEATSERIVSWNHGREASPSRCARAARFWATTQARVSSESGSSSQR